MPAVNPGRVSVNSAGKGIGKRRVKRVASKPIAGPPAPQKVTVVAPADRVSDRVEARAKQLKVSVKKAGDAPQNRAPDTARADKFKQTDGYVKTVKEFQAPLKKYTVYKVRKGEPRAGSDAELRQTLTTGKRPRRVEATGQTKLQNVAAAPALKVLEQTTRPLHAIAAATDAAIHGGRVGTIGTGPSPTSVLRAAGRGLQNKDKTTFSDVIKHAGVKNKAVAGAGGLALDIALDPTTYVTGGTGSIAAREAEKAAVRTEKKALERGASAKDAKDAADKVRDIRAKRGDQAKGVTVKVAGRELPGVRKATAKAGKGGGKVLRTAVPEKVRNAVRDATSEVNPNVAPAGVDKATHQAARAASRKARAATTKGEREAINLGHGIKSQIGAGNYARVVDAIESDTAHTLPPKLRKHAETVSRHLAEIRKVQKKAGLKAPERKGYVPRKLTDDALKTDQKAAARAGRPTVELKSSKARKEQRPMAQVRVTDPGRYRQDLHALVAERMAEGTGAAARATLAKDVADLGHEIPRGSRPTLSPREAVYKFKDGKLTEVDTNSKAFQKKPPAGTPLKAKYVVLNKALVDRTLGTVAPSKGGTILHGYDKAQGGFKRIALATPGFHIRNAIGDTAQAYVHQPGQKLPGNMVRAGRVLKAQGRIEKAEQALGEVKHARDISKRPVKRTRLQVQRALRGRDLGRGDNSYLAGKLTTDAGPPNGLTSQRRVLAGGDHVTEYRIFDGSGKNIGWASTHSNGGRKVYVDPAYRRKGIATKLYNAAEKDGYDVRSPGGGNMQTELGDVLNRSTNGGGKLKTKKYGHVTYEEAAQRLVEAGAARSGYTSRELRELAGSGEKKLKLPKTPGGVRRAFLNREDLPRLATAIHAVRQGATWEEAAAKVADVHFDYADLTPFERNIARRIMPFYTWTARNVPLQSKRILTNPGKYANYQKVREEASKLSDPGGTDPKTQALYKQLEAAGVKLDGGWEKYLTEYEKRNVGVPVSWKGQKFTLSAGLPLADLNELPGLSGPGEYLNKAASLVTPLVKDPVEFGFNYSFFFRDQIERDNSPLVAAPSFVRKWPESAKKKFGIVKGQDKRSGKMVWQWPGKADYVAHAVPGLPSTVVRMMTPGHDQAGKGVGAKALGVAGIKSTPVDARSNAINLAYARGEEIQKKQAVLRAQKNPENGALISAKNPTPEYTRLSLQLRAVNQIAYQGKLARGDAKLPTQGGPKKGRSSAGRVRVPGVSGRVKLPGASGRVKVP